MEESAEMTEGPEVIMEDEGGREPYDAPPYEHTDGEEAESYEEAFGGFYEGLESHFTELMKQSQRAPKDGYEHLQAFLAAVNWTEPWLRILLGFHVLLFLIALIWRRDVDVQMAVLVVICMLVFGAEHLNTFCREHWRFFATQNYFDEHGSFAGAVLATPLLCIAFFQLINLLVLASSALITAKRLQLKAKIRADAKNKKE